MAVYIDGRTLLQQDAACKAIVHVPEIDARDAALIVPDLISLRYNQAP